MEGAKFLSSQVLINSVAHSSNNLCSQLQFGVPIWPLSLPWWLMVLFDCFWKRKSYGLSQRSEQWQSLPKGPILTQLSHLVARYSFLLSNHFIKLCRHSCPDLHGDGTLWNSSNKMEIVIWKAFLNLQNFELR